MARAAPCASERPPPLPPATRRSSKPRTSSPRRSCRSVTCPPRRATAAAARTRSACRRRAPWWRARARPPGSARASVRGARSSLGLLRECCGCACSSDFEGATKVGGCACGVRRKGRRAMRERAHLGGCLEAEAEEEADAVHAATRRHQGGRESCGRGERVRKPTAQNAASAAHSGSRGARAASSGHQRSPAAHARAGFPNATRRHVPSLRLRDSAAPRALGAPRAALGAPVAHRASESTALKTAGQQREMRPATWREGPGESGTPSAT
eukprot:3345781-Prymnesium_polylepis.2